MVKKMKLSIIFMISFLLVSLVVALIIGGYSIYLHNNHLIEEVHDDIEYIAKNSAKQVNLFLEGEKQRAVDFASDGFIKNSLKELKTNPSEEVMKKLSEHLINNKIVVDESFYEVMVLDANGKVVATTNLEEEFGVDFSEDLIFIEGRKSAYVKDTFYDGEFKRYGVVFSAPVLIWGEFLGVVVIRMNLEKINEIISDAGEFEEQGEVYLIDRNSMMVTPSKFLKGEGKGAFVQEVRSENSENCFKMKIPGEHEHKVVVSFLDYRGEEVIGSHEVLQESWWCLLVEVDEYKVLDIPLKKYIINQIIISIIVILILTLVGFFTGKYFEKKRGKR